ncbi:SDR family oxidoreductase [Mesorhizobium sp. M1D.F.Ca.ET.043.01.1.1]|uniref:SDR family oxidoreductase n=1 Tax=Mesorhizobium sp. M1D.F.Ca.ET.043.01.1.1 TaxID=2493669 RepID=UPI000F75454D|nr:SDR family oxidoreductase [Mesorhizobium sp. M1D.F.Ca.ET.043.01.1.1]AZO69967.1 SDR family oxidoreductase [Mesorhizobium sp. M1D.F.Ca.ET.043.01.1.1]
MKIVVIGGTGLIGSKTVERLRKKGHDVLAASPNGGVNTITGEGLAEALAGAQVVVDLANSPSFEDKAVLDFFETSGRNLLAAGKVAGVKHHIALSIVGVERLPDSGYMRAKMAQERLIRNSGIPYTIIHSTQFFEFLSLIAQSGTVGDIATIPYAYFQPIASDDVSDFVAEVAISPPANGVIEIAGPEPMRMSDLVARFLKASNDPRRVTGDPHARYFGAELDDRSLVPSHHPRIGATSFENWFSQSPPQRN